MSAWKVEANDTILLSPCYSAGPRSGYDRVHLDIHPCCHSTKYKLIAFDTETDGCSPPREFHLQKLVEIAAHGLESGQGMQTLVNNEGPV